MLDLFFAVHGFLTWPLAQAPPPGGNMVAMPKPSAAQNDTFLSIVFSGGILGIGIMLALIGLSLITVYLIVDQALTLRKKDILPSDFAESIRQLLVQGRLKEADQL